MDAKKIEKAEGRLKRKFEKLISKTEIEINKLNAQIQNQRSVIETAQVIIINHGREIEQLEQEKLELLKDFADFKDTMD